MKQQVNPVAMGILIAVVLAIVVLVGMRSLNPPAPVASKPASVSDKPAEINGHPVPNNVPYYLMQKQAQGGTSGPGQMPHP